MLIAIIGGVMGVMVLGGVVLFIVKNAFARDPAGDPLLR